MQAPRFKKKRRGVAGLSASSTSLGSTVATVGDTLGTAKSTVDDAASDNEQGVIIRRTSKKGEQGSSKQAAVGSASSKTNKGVTSLSFDGDAIGASHTCDPEVFAIRRSKLALAARQGLSYHTETSESEGATQVYSATQLADLKASTPNFQKKVTGVIASRDVPTDPVLQTNQTMIPSELAVQNAKQRRQRAAQELSSTSTRDFISLSSSQDGAHPQSRLKREDDDVGSGEDEFGGFTVDEERLALNMKDRKKADVERRQKMREAFEGVHIDAGAAEDSDEEEQRREEMDWEAAQLARWQNPVRMDENEQYYATRVPEVAAIPDLSAASARISAVLTDLEEIIANRQRLIDDSRASQQRLDNDAAENRRLIEAMDAKEAWYREFQEFTETLADFLDDKAPILEAIENERTYLLRDINNKRQTLRARQLEDLSSLFQGIPRLAVWSDDEADVRAYSPAEDGGPESSVREQRRVDSVAGLIADGLLDPQAEEGLARLSARLNNLFDDVKAPEFVDPAARSDADKGGALHPRSVLARFAQWRERFSGDYSGAWGGLALAGIWDFWIRKELVGKTLRGFVPLQVEALSWQMHVHEFQEIGAGIPDAISGDDEILDHMITNSVATTLRSLAEGGAYDPWSVGQSKAVGSLVTELAEVMDTSSATFKSLVVAFARPLIRWTDGLLQAVTETGVLPSSAQGKGGRAEQARREIWEACMVLFVQNFGTLGSRLRNAEPLMAEMLHSRISKIFAALISGASEAEAKTMAAEIASALPRGHSMVGPELASLLGYAT
ncbi:hypothetical protein K437DRAFT_255299 [Tilletiaria anomala UBC 951]|uniref:GCFC-domain-containing protein n=1 Tax=Tilletiaria anomala (strain ATCC 24038 / CBS 436.72 / UBC 951) TaxID=1037660 RepID=A0A066WFT3_TILAU|nr:uncharacterized protein K437DRAFT_255299 [Tilletiaria anomala UBC 951]KDN49615.1 hypothetical protein K437DRAFT_255299 [Tilletiaria anomala UBC 951]